MRKTLLGMAVAAACMIAGPAFASSCGYPARTLDTIKAFDTYGGVKTGEVAALMDGLRDAADAGMVQMAAFKPGLPDAEREAFFAKAEANVAERVALLHTLAEKAKTAGANPDAVAWVTNHADALQTCGVSAARTDNGSRLDQLVTMAQPYRSDAIVAKMLDGLPLACNDGMLNAGIIPPDAGTPEAYKACAAMVVKVASRRDDQHFSSHHLVADPACELATRLKALMLGSKPVPALHAL
ncbi:MAG: hypothetical protein EON60_02675 [Alphaproteobacteria bacterium]|nr:MAG: hypothetical protein EON60_02675 [Alphaproteobacteria bacterium]